MHLTALKLQLRKSVKHIRKSYVSWRIKNCKIITATWILGYFAILSLCAPQSREFHTSNVPWSSKIKAHLKNGSMDVWKLPQNQMWITITPNRKKVKVLTAEVEVDAGRNLSILVLGFHFVKSSVSLDDIIEFQNHRVLVPPVLVDADSRPVVLHNRHVLPEPHHLRFWTGSWNCGLVQ